MLVYSLSRWKISMTNNINTDSGELSLLMCGASLLFTPFAGLTKGWIFVFLPWGGPWLVSVHLLQTVVRLLLMLAVPVAAVVVPLLPPQNRFQHCYPQHLILSRCQQPEFHWWLPPRVWFFSWLLLNTYNGLPYWDSFLWLGTVAET